MKRNPSCLPSVRSDELASVTGGAARVATASGSIDSNTLEMMFSQLQSSVQNIANAQQNSAGNLLPVAAMAFALRGNQAPAAQPLVIPIPSGGGWHHHRHRC